MFSDIETILEIFTDASFCGMSESTFHKELLFAGGFHVLRGTAPRDRGPVDRAKLNKDTRKAYEMKYARAKVAKRLLAGERPTFSKRGRPPTRWLEVAAELGIELERAA